ncbi:hypothetical protein FBU59_002812 [Linderina macrospora]|uniref:Uncharacterized protein n=1 Tax=Linderina macrospora TaxID=4868 RepID=A0ACC1JAA3_9FUNG|nr:hypothetical protein FBU59_002812 [Linderina macrospora]
MLTSTLEYLAMVCADAGIVQTNSTGLAAPKGDAMVVAEQLRDVVAEQAQYHPGTAIFGADGQVECSRCRIKQDLSAYSERALYK